MENSNRKEQILVRITGQDRPGLTASIMAILAKYDAQILDIGQADIHSTLSLGILIRMDETHSGQVMKELLFKATELGVQIGFSPISDDEYEDWVGHQGKNRYILMVMGRQLEARQIEGATRILADQGFNIDSILRLTGRKSIKNPTKAHPCLHPVLVARRTHRPSGDAVEADEVVAGDGDRLLFPTRRHVPSYASSHMLRYGLYADSDRMYR